ETVPAASLQSGEVVGLVGAGAEAGYGRRTDPSAYRFSMRRYQPDSAMYQGHGLPIRTYRASITSAYASTFSQSCITAATYPATAQGKASGWPCRTHSGWASLNC